jgi:hypothetical protein
MLLLDSEAEAGASATPRTLTLRDRPQSELALNQLTEADQRGVQFS